MSIVYDMPDVEYHARPELSSTEARLLLESPAKYRWRKDNPPLIDDSSKFDIGEAVHGKVLGAGADTVVVDADDWRSKAAREAREEARAAGLAPLLKREAEMVDQMTDSVLAHPTARALLEQDGYPEVSLFTEVDGVPVRARFDFLPARSERRTVAVDLKTTVSAAKSDFEKSVAKYEYPVQRAWYLDAYTELTGDTDAEFVFIAVEKEPPYLVAVYQLPTVWAEKGHVMADRARKLWAACIESGAWPGYPSDVQLLDEPTWHVYEFEEKYANA